MSLAIRCAKAAAVGAGLGAGWALLASEPDWAGASECPAGQFCLGYAVLVMPVLVVAGLIVGGWVLHSVGVRPAVLPALLGPLVALFLSYVVANISFSSDSGDTPYLILSSIAVLVGYVLAAFLTARELSTRWRVVAIVLAALGMLVLRMLVP